MKISILGIIKLMLYIIAPFITYFVTLFWNIFWSLYPSLNISAIFPYLDPLGGYSMCVLSILCVTIYIFRWRTKFGFFIILALVALSISVASKQPNIILETGADLNPLVFTLSSSVAWLDLILLKISPKISTSQSTLLFMLRKTTYKEVLISSFSLIGFPLFITDVLIAVMKMVQTSHIYTVGGGGLSDGLNGGILAIVVFSFILFIPELLKNHKILSNNILCINLPS